MYFVTKMVLAYFGKIIKKSVNKLKAFQDEKLELVSKELNHFGGIAGLSRQSGGHSSRFELFCSF